MQLLRGAAAILADAYARCQAAVVLSALCLVAASTDSQAASSNSQSYYLTATSRNHGQNTSGETVDSTGASAELDSQAAMDEVTVQLDSSGSPILPQEKARKGGGGGGGGGTPIPPPNELSFTFNSPQNPWTLAEENTLRQAISDIYPVAKAVYGAPAFAMVVNVRKGSELTYSGEYNPSLNEIVLLDASRFDVLCHEMLHAFRDANMIGFSSFEEGMVRAAEIEVFNRLPGYDYPMGKHHSYGYDVYYEGLNKPAIGAQNGDFFAGYVSPLLRYQLAGYAWGKAFLENPRFFVDFNQRFYSQAATDPSVRASESKLLALLAAVQPTVEGKKFGRWYGQQGVLNMNPPKGYMLYNRLNVFTFDFFFRGEDGRETMLPNESIMRAINNYEDLVLDSASDLTGEYGFVSYDPVVPADYVGRAKVVGTAAFYPAGASVQSLVTDVSYEPVGFVDGIFGVVAEQETGTVQFMPLDTPAQTVNASLVNGAFSAPGLAAVKGRFVATVTDLAGRTVSRQFTKDASDYYLPLSTTAPSTDLSVTQTMSRKITKTAVTITYTMTVKNLGMTAATDILLVNNLPAGAVLGSVSAAGGSYSAASVPVNGYLTANWETLAAGASAAVTATVTFRSPAPASIANKAMVLSSSVDSNPANNTFVLATSGGK